MCCLEDHAEPLLQLFSYSCHFYRGRPLNNNEWQCLPTVWLDTSVHKNLTPYDMTRRSFGKHNSACKHQTLICLQLSNQYKQHWDMGGTGVCLDIISWHILSWDNPFSHC